MVKDFFQEIDQRLFMVDEHVYGEHYDPESEHVAWAAISAAFPHVIPINIITDSFDYTLPRRLRDKIYAVGGGKHPAMIVNTIQEPVEISLETKMQHPLFMAYAIGQETSGPTGAVVEITAITFATVTDSSAQGKYFLINSIDANGEDHWAFWVSDVGDDTGKPTIAGIATANIYKMDLSGAVDPTNPTGAELATAFSTAADAADDYFATPAVASAKATVTGVSPGAVRDCRDSGVDPLGISVSVTTQGSSTHTITESTGYALPSFTFHIEQYNSSDATESIYLDLFGCVVTDCEITIDYADKIVKEAVTFKSVNFAVGNLLTNPPNFIEILEPFIWDALTVASNEYLMQSTTEVPVTTDRTPEIVNKTSLKVTNDIMFQPGIGVLYPTTVINKKREVSLNIVGYTKLKDLYDYHNTDTWDNANGRYTTLAARLNTVFKLKRTATVDLFEIHIYNWLIEEGNYHIFNIDEGILGLDVTFTDATPYTDKRIIVKIAGTAGFIISDYLSDTCYHNGTWTP